MTMTLKQFARLGGQARAAGLSAAERSRIAKIASDSATIVRKRKSLARRSSPPQQNGITPITTN
jgi:hypothetical protein